MELMVIDALLLFVTVITFAGEMATIPVEVNVNEVGLRASATVGPPVAVPANPTTVGLNAPLVLTARAPLIEPLYCGAKVTTMVQLEDAARELPQVPPVTE